MAERQHPVVIERLHDDKVRVTSSSWDHEAGAWQRSSARGPQHQPIACCKEAGAGRTNGTPGRDPYGADASGTDFDLITNQHATRDARSATRGAANE